MTAEQRPRVSQPDNSMYGPPPSDMTADQWIAFNRTLHERQFTETVAHPGAWRLSARDLLLAANILAEKIIPARERDWERILKNSTSSGVLTGQEEQDFNIRLTTPIWIMLYGLAIENLIKGLIAAHEGAKIHRNERKELDVGQHSLVRLAKRARLKLSDDENTILEELTHFILWRGKYMRPMSAKAYVEFEETKRPSSKLVGLRPKEQKKWLDDFVTKLDNELLSMRNPT